MKKIGVLKPLFLAMLFFFGISESKAQDDVQCGTVVTPEAEAYFEQLLPQIQQYEQEFSQLALQRASTAINSVPIKVHIIRTDAGTGGLFMNQLNAAMNIVNSFYANAFLEFFLCEGVNYIDDTDLYDFETNEQDAMVAQYNVDNVVNIYFANTVTSSSSGNGLCGYAYFPGGPEVILMNNSCATNGSTLSHEIGHFFGLSHTHGDFNGTLTNELVDGSNCTTAGDRICDTPADPQLGSSNVTVDCNYIGNDLDANNQFFNPDVFNVMSYSRKACRTQFSAGQYARIYAVYQAARSVMACPSFNVDIAADYERYCGNDLEVSFTDNSVGATSWEWDVDGDDITDYTSQNITHIYSNASNYDVTLKISNGSETITKVFQDYIDEGGTIINTEVITLSLTLDDWPDETSWTFSDADGNVLYSSPIYTDGVDDFANIFETFDVDLNNCYTFEITDTTGDGICCSSGFGSFTLTTSDGTVIATDGSYQFGTKVFMENGVALSVDDFFTNNAISLFPNPAQSNITIKMANSNELPDSFTIYNMLGQQVTSKTIYQESDLNVDVSRLSDGMYFMELKKETDTSVIQFVKQ